MRKSFLLISILALVMAGCSKSPKQTTGIDLSNLDTTAVPQNDFYQFACGGWMANHPLTDEYARFGTFDKLGEDVREQTKGLIVELASKEHQHGTVEQKIGDMYNLAMDSVRRNEEGFAPIEGELATINNIKDIKEVSGLLGSEPNIGMFGLYVDAELYNSKMNILQTYQGGFALGQKDYYVKDDSTNRNIRAEYLKHIAKMFQLIGVEEAQAQQNAQTVLRMETRLATAAKSNVELRDPEGNYNEMSLDSLKTLVPQIDWDALFAAAGIKTNRLSVCQPQHLQEVGKMLVEEPLDDWKTYFTWQVIDGAASSLSDEFSEQNFDFYGRVLTGRKEQSPRWKRAVSAVNGTLGEAVGQMYVQKYFPPEAKARMEKLVANLQVALGQRIDSLTWMGDTTKAKAHEKLDAFYVKIGYPNKWRDYSALDIDAKESYYANLVRAQKFEQEYNYSFIDQPVDRDKWYMTPQTVNAYYNPSTNEICFPAAILQPPFFDMQADDAANYGAIGVVIGHEMTHGFDDQGAQFDKDGNLNNWWTEADRANFKARTKVMADHFNSIKVLDDPETYGNGELTLGENIADHGGLQVAFLAFKNATKDNPLQDADGFTPEQRFFLAYANVWAGNIRKEAILQRTVSDPHSLGRWRVNGALPEVQAWYDAWNVTENDSLYIAPEDRVYIW
ncbi:MAG: M13 family metallopeptidase [Paludibacteraceae bacterium]|nr:M13 family metallopeptidase [Paludibacteraceae bacterium]